MKKGFTLVELVVMIMILAILAVVTIPRITSIRDVRLNMAVRKLSQDMKYAHEYAVINKINTRVRFDQASDTYYVEEETAPNTWTSVANPDTGGNFEVVLDTGSYAGVTLQSADFDGGTEVRFDQWGVSHDSGGNLGSRGSVVLEAGGDTGSVYVDPETGRVYLRGLYYYSF